MAAGYNGRGKTACTLCWCDEDVCRKHVSYSNILKMCKLLSLGCLIKLYFVNREKVNKGIGIENVHYLNDGLWHMKTYK